MIDKRISKIEAIVSCGNFSESILKRMAIPDEYLLSNSKLYIMYKETGVPLEAMNAIWGEKVLLKWLNFDYKVTKVVW